MEEKIKEKSHSVFFIKMLIFIALIFARNIMEMPISPAILLLFSGLIAITSDKNEILALMTACIPLGAAFQYKYLILLCIVIYYAKFYKNIVIATGAWILISMMMWEAFHALGEEFLLNDYLRGFAELIAVTLIIMDKKKTFNFALISRTLAISTIAMCLVILMNLFKDGSSLADIFAGTYRFGVGNTEAENFGVNFNANALGFICNLSVAGLLQLTMLKKQNVLDYIMIIMLLFFGLLTMSRTFLVCCALIFVLFVLARSTNIAGTLRAIIGTAIFIGVIFFVVSKFAPFIIEQIMGRFRVSDITSGRSDLLAFYNSHLASNSKYLFFGIGMQDVMGKIYRIYWDTTLNVPHNGIQELLVVWGVPGLLLFTMFIVNLIKASSAKHKLVNYIPLALLLLQVQSGQMITSGIILLAFLIIYVSLCESFEEIKGEIAK